MPYNATTLLFSLLLLVSTLSGSSQALDPSFPPVALQTSAVSGLIGYVAPLVQSDGKIVVIGGFQFVNASATGNLVRLNADGTQDGTFNPGGAGFNGAVKDMLLQPDGKIVVVGSFTRYNGGPVANLVRLLPDGTPDPLFAAAAVVRFPTCLAIQTDGKLLIGDDGRTLANGRAATNGLTRLQPNGTPDPTFILPPFAPTEVVQVRKLLVQTDGKIVVSGTFGSFGGLPAPGLARLNANGTADSGFVVTGGPCGSVTSLTQQPDGKLLIAGGFYWCGTVQPEPSHIVRLLSNGTLDPTFTTAFLHGQYPIYSMAVEPTGLIVLGGAFTFLSNPSSRVVRLQPTGARDFSFATGTGPDDAVKALVPNPGGGYVLAGDFRNVDGLARANLARLLPSGTLDASFATVLAVSGYASQAVPLANGQLLVTGNFDKFNGVSIPVGSGTVRRVTATGALDAAFVSTATGQLCGVGAAGNFYLAISGFPNGSPALQSCSPNGAIQSNNILPGSIQGGYTAQKVEEQVDGRLLVSGGRSLLMGGFVSGPVILRLNSGGGSAPAFTLTTCQQTGGFGYGGRAWLQPDSKIITHCSNGILSRLNADGSPDNSFSSSTVAGYPAMLLQPNGQLLIGGGRFNSSTGQTSPFGLVRLTLSGSPDPTFVGATDSCILRAVQPDGRILVTVGRGANSVLARLNSNGSPDNTFAPVAIPRGEYSVNLQPTDGKIVLVGSFTSVAGQPRQNLARLTNPGVLATRSSRGVSPLLIYPNPAHQQLTVQLSAATGAGDVSLFDLSGRLIQSWTWLPQQTQAHLDVSAQPEGLYLLRISTTTGRYQQKISVTH